MSSPLWLTPVKPGDRLRFVFVFVSCVRACERAGEAKLRVGVSEAFPLSLGLRTRSFVGFLLVGCLFFVRRREGSKLF